MTLPRILALLVFMLPGLLAAQPMSDPDFSAGNAAYTQALKASGNDAAALYGQAVEHYLRALQRGDSWVLHYNLGNALSGMGEFGPAALHYERALAINPTKAEIAANLALARRSAGLPGRRPAGWMEEWALNLPLRYWTLVAFVGGWIALGLIVLPPLFKGYSPLALGLASLGALAFVAALFGIAGWHQQSRWQIVLLPEAPLLAAPLDDSADIRRLPAATGVLPERHHERWTYVRTESGDYGWIESKQAEAVWREKDEG